MALCRHHIPLMFRIMSAGVLMVAIAACTPTQQVDISDQKSGRGNVVTVQADGLSPGEIAKLNDALVQAGFIPSGDGDATVGSARVIFGVGEAKKTETVVEVPEYEVRQEVRFINGRNRVFTDERFVGYRREYITSTVYPSFAELRVETPSEARAVRKVETEGSCGDPKLLRPALIDVLLSSPKGGAKQIELPGC
jgi:hypothetical protein